MKLEIERPFVERLADAFPRLSSWKDTRPRGTAWIAWPRGEP
jgi:hypothetical protein